MHLKRNVRILLTIQTKMDRGDKIAITVVGICFIIFMLVDTFETKSNNDRFDKIEKELHELKTK